MKKNPLYADINPVRFSQFVLVGLSGLLVNALILGWATESLGWYYLFSAALATVGSTLWNFSLSEGWVFRGRSARTGVVRRLVQFSLMNAVALLVRGPLMWCFTSGLGIHYQLSNIASIAIMTIVRYLLANQWIWNRLVPDSYYYNVHDILTIESAVALPELEPLRTEQLIEQPTLQVRIGSAVNGQPPPNGRRRLNYTDGLGLLGFQMQIDQQIDCCGGRIEVMAAPLLRWSPHVLYTNVVEPLLRWMLVARGYALVHGACLALDGRAYLITARTDTGKTTALLQLLRNQRPGMNLSFIADDLTLIDRDGNVLPFPKPLTVSAHTVRAINANCLAWHERVFLPIQSQVHSRGGRRFAHKLAMTKLPTATINAYVQSLIPPPKYFVEQLVPGTPLARQAKLRAMYVIERAVGDEGETDVDRPLLPTEALTILLRNCDDAYGFPPYADIEAFLYHAPSWGNLRRVEREIVGQALRGVPSILFRRRRGDWWQSIMEHIEALAAEKA